MTIRENSPAGKKILVSGLINIETTVQIDGFPIPYFPVRYPFHRINTTVSGVGYNIAKALTVLGDEVDFLSLIGSDFVGRQVTDALAQDGINSRMVLKMLEKTAQSVILYDRKGNRQIHVDLKDVQETPYPMALFEQALEQCDLAVLSNINFSRPMLAKAAAAEKLIATDVHTISKIDSEYDRDFMEHAGILMMSGENLPVKSEEWVKQIQNRYNPAITLVGLGEKGSLLAVKKDNFMERIPAVKTREIVSTIGAGDALFAAFLHFYHKNQNPYEAIKKATVFASYKIGETGAAEGFLNEADLEKLYSEVYSS